MSYESVSFLSSVENPVVVSQVARRMQPDTKFVIAETESSGPDIMKQGLDYLKYLFLIGGIAILGYYGVKAFGEYLERRREKNKMAFRGS